jgi:hypothetical protein
VEESRRFEERFVSQRPLNNSCKAPQRRKKNLARSFLVCEVSVVIGR